MFSNFKSCIFMKIIPYSTGWLGSISRHDDPLGSPAVGACVIRDASRTIAIL